MSPTKTEDCAHRPDGLWAGLMPSNKWCPECGALLWCPPGRTTRIVARPRHGSEIQELFRRMRAATFHAPEPTEPDRAPSAPKAMAVRLVNVAEGVVRELGWEPDSFLVDEIAVALTYPVGRVEQLPWHEVFEEVLGEVCKREGARLDAIGAAEATCRG